MITTANAVQGWLALGSAWWAALAVGVFAWFRMRPADSAATRHAVLATAILGGLLAGLLPRWGSGVVKVAAPTAEVAPFATPPDATLTPVIPQQHDAQPLIAPRSQTSVTDSTPKVATAPTAPSVFAPPPRPRDWLAIGRLSLGAVWLTGAALLGIRLVSAVGVARRWRKEAAPLPGEEQRLFDACREELHVRRRANVGTHAEPPAPLVLCGRPPWLLAPSDWLALPESSRRAAWRHELAHVRRRDDWWRLLSEALRVVWWFHPGVHWLLVRREHEAELLSDEAAINPGFPPKQLAQLLLDACRRPQPTRARLIVPAASFLTPRTMKIRIARLANAASAEALCRPAPRGLRWAAAFGMLALALAGSMRWIGPIHAAPPEKEKVVVNSKIPETMHAASPPVGAKVSGVAELPSRHLFRRQVRLIAVMGPKIRPIDFEGVSVDFEDGRVVEGLKWKHVHHATVVIRSQTDAKRVYATTVRNGTFALPEFLPPGQYRADASVILQADDDVALSLGELPVDLNSQTELFEVPVEGNIPISLTLKLHPAAFNIRVLAADPKQAEPILCGTVKDPAGVPAAEAVVEVYAGSATRWRVASTKTDSQGRYRFLNVRSTSVNHGVPGELFYLCGVRVAEPNPSPAANPKLIDREVSARLGHVETLDLTTFAGGILTGMMTSADGSPAANLPLFLRGKQAEAKAWRFALTGANGNFRSPRLPVGTYEILAGPENALRSLGKVEVKAGEVVGFVGTNLK